MSNNDDWKEVADRPLPRFSKEIPYDPHSWTLAKQPAIPETELQALMETAPGQNPVPSKERLGVTIDRLADIVENVLTEEERAVIEVTVYAGHSIRNAAKILGWPKSTVHRLKDSATRIIERELRNDIPD